MKTVLTALVFASLFAFAALFVGQAAHAMGLRFASEITAIVPTETR